MLAVHFFIFNYLWKVTCCRMFTFSYTLFFYLFSHMVILLLQARSTLYDEYFTLQYCISQVFPIINILIESKWAKKNYMKKDFIERFFERPAIVVYHLDFNIITSELAIYSSILMNKTYMQCLCVSW